MLGEILNGFQNLHFDTLTLSPIKANWVERWSKTQVTSLKGPMMWVSFAKDGKMQLGARAMVFRKVRKWAKTNKGPPRGVTLPCA